MVALERFTVPGEPRPFSDQTLVDVRAGRADVIGDERGVAVVRDGELELVVALEERGHGLGTALVAQVLGLDGGAGTSTARLDGGAGTSTAPEAVAPHDGRRAPSHEGATSAAGRVPPPRLAWAHGDHPAARAIAERYGWTAARTLLQLRAPIASTTPDPAAPDGWTLSSFRPGDEQDESDWLALNAAAFAHHPEQGRMTLDDLRAREGEDWFAGEDLLLLRDEAGELVGSCWLKVEGDTGEFYAVAVRPDRQGQGLGGVLMRAGTARLTGRGLTAAALYVEGDNEPALALYRRSGFVQHAIDVQYAAPAR